MEKKNIDWGNLGFSYMPTDYRYISDFKDGAWDEGRLITDASVTVSECAGILQYCQQVFEGLKAYKTASGEVRLFRPDCNGERLNNSAIRLSLPTLPVQDFIDACKALVDLERDWVPEKKGESLYIRPILMSVEPDLSLHCSEHCMFVIMCSPVGNYYKEGLKPVSIAIEKEDSRTVKGGTGFAKCGGNYAASNRAGDRALEKGYSQVLWLDGVHRKYIEEVGAMNVMFKIDGTVVTPSLENGSILGGITRKSCIEVLKSWGMPVEERLLSAEELFNAAENGKLEEAWGIGTAAVISPIGELSYKGKSYIVNDFKIGETEQKLYDALTGIQWGKAPDTFGWTELVCK